MVECLRLQCGQAGLRLVPEWGARITACSLVDAEGAARPVLHPYPEHHTDLEHWGKGGLYPLVPYSGRLRNAKIACGQGAWLLAPYGESAHTLHGIAHRRPWRVQHHRAAAATLRYNHEPDVHWPWRFEARLMVDLQEHALTVTAELLNTDRSPMPGGLGFHPYVPIEAGHDIRFTASAPCVFDSDYLVLPTTCPPAQTMPHRLGLSAADPREVTQMHALWDGQIQSGSKNRMLYFDAQGALTHLIVHRPPASPYVCIEPVSHLPDAFNLHPPDAKRMGARILQPGQCLRAVLRLGVVKNR